MPRKLKTFTTSAGFFDLAVAAPSMKAALEAWGSRNNLFHQGFAKATDDRDIVAATMAKPGVVLRRPVGTDRPFTEGAELPRDFANVVEGGRGKTTSRPKHHSAPVDEKTARQAAVQYAREQKQRDREARREQVAREKARERQERAIAVAEAAIEKADRVHRTKVADLEQARSALDRKLEAENERWEDENERLEAALRKAQTRS